jgi:hypothetical protein
MNGECRLCGKHGIMERHHVFGGACRKLSEKYGLVVDLCHYCHNEPPNGVHFNREVRERLQAQYQQAAMDRYGWTIEEFIQKFGRNYL